MPPLSTTPTQERFPPQNLPGGVTVTRFGDALKCWRNEPHIKNTYSSDFFPTIQNTHVSPVQVVYAGAPDFTRAPRTSSGIPLYQLGGAASYSSFQSSRSSVVTFGVTSLTPSMHTLPLPPTHTPDSDIDMASSDDDDMEDVLTNNASRVRQLDDVFDLSKLARNLDLSTLQVYFKTSLDGECFVLYDILDYAQTYAKLLTLKLHGAMGGTCAEEANIALIAFKTSILTHHQRLRSGKYVAKQVLNQSAEECTTCSCFFPSTYHADLAQVLWEPWPPYTS